MADCIAAPVFINSVLESGKAGPRLVAQTVDIGAIRQIRRHKKSRRGCLGCKIRKVKCDESQPCSSCLKRGTECKSPNGKSIAPRQPKLVIDSGLDLNPDLSLLQLELFHHWDKHTKSTLVYPEIWPVIMQQAVHENFLMAAILCTSSMHLSTFHPQNTWYPQFARRLMPNTISLFRQSLSKPLTKSHSEAIVGAALLVNYISWFDVSFLDGNTSRVGALAHDQLLLISSGIVHAWFQTIPILIEKQSIFPNAMMHHPRLVIEQTLAKRSNDDTSLFVQPLMDIWNDRRYQTSGHLAADRTVYEPATNGAWRLLQDFESELVPADDPRRLTGQTCDESQKLLHYKEKVTKITKTPLPANGSPELSDVPPPLQARASFEYIVRRLSPLLRCQAAMSDSSAETRSDMAALRDNLEGLIYGFPILCCGPFADLVQRRDTRALVLLLHFYRCAGILLDPKRCWWATARSRIMENLIFKELVVRGVSTGLAEHNYN